MSRALSIFQGRLGRVALLDMDKSLVTHAHRGCHVLLKFGGANTFFDVRGEVCALTDTTAVLVNAWEPHAYTHIDDAPQTIILALYIDPTWLGMIDRRLLASGHSRFFPQPVVDIGRPIRDRTHELGLQLLTGADLDPDDTEAAVFELMKDVIDGFADRKTTGNAEESVWMGDHRVRRSIRLMQDSLHEPFDAMALSRRAGMSRPHFFARFRQVTGLTPALFYNTLRMEAATKLLAGGGVPLLQVAQDLGFDAHSNFTRFFRQHQGVAPSEYRRVAHFAG
ncbi:MAG: helix-turn-helix transcriptional regulator [Hyphomicrobiales bacterium]|nr:helix-turn-helix transcriptional regulator [Hyphomicrobiales bacterium]